ncbi:ubiquitin carboxyl-terminal hydrolase 2-like [Corticium candelabrum]|uniref:ubiquitin carboxyl-terminal hydrolase 2-like n=1 Tax=Corticium candelabrum TaxID=121492 RepID=UPI002E26B42D|nr:ubiquitin carboxyl-terminal hydrolase 2-like [Corticium candelabrum]
MKSRDVNNSYAFHGGSREKLDVGMLSRDVGCDGRVERSLPYGSTAMRRAGSMESLMSVKIDDDDSHDSRKLMGGRGSFTPTPRRRSHSSDMNASHQATPKTYFSDLHGTTSRQLSYEDLMKSLSATRLRSDAIKRDIDFTSVKKLEFDRRTHTYLGGSRTSQHSDSSGGSKTNITLGSRSSGSSGNPGGLVGLRNLGNTCFMNSVLQCLSHTKPLSCFFNKDITMKISEKSSMKGRLVKAFADLMSEMWTSPSQDSVVSPSLFKLRIQRFAPRFVGYSQQDSQEFLRFLLDGLHDELNQATGKPEREPPLLKGSELAEWSWNNYKKYAYSKITELFVGQLKSTVTCTRCGNISDTYDPFWDLSLPIPQKKRSSYTQPYSFTSSYLSSSERLGFSTSIVDTPSLIECFQLFTKEETLDEDDKPYCSSCRAKTKSTKQMMLDRLPPVLVIHLKRFGGFRFRTKVSTVVSFPTEKPLDLAQFCSSKQATTSASYHLYAVSNHSGSTFGGHYTAHCYHHKLKTWYSFSDSHVHNVSVDSVCGSQAYVLFYERERERESRL